MARKPVETTLYSLSDKPPVCPDRRQNERYISLLRVGAMMIEGRRELCLIRNVSAGGMMIKPYSPVAAGTHISVELKHGDAVSGVASWAVKGLDGISFDRPFDVIALLSAPGSGPRSRLPRIELSCRVTLRQNANVIRAEVVNISQGGICVKTDSALEVDGDIVVSLAGPHAAAGVVKWEEGDCYGIGFNRVYPIGELMGFLKEQQGLQRAVA